MLRLDVAAQVDLTLERARLLADAAREWLEAGVLATVSDEIRRLTKRLTALTTTVRLFTCMRVRIQSREKLIDAMELLQCYSRLIGIGCCYL